MTSCTLVGVDKMTKKMWSRKELDVVVDDSSFASEVDGVTLTQVASVATLTKAFAKCSLFERCDLLYQ